jgi:hypothetical protein
MPYGYKAFRFMQKMRLYDGRSIHCLAAVIHIVWRPSCNAYNGRRTLSKNLECLSRISINSL